MNESKVVSLMKAYAGFIKDIQDLYELCPYLSG